ncbi:unnamed protein product [Anisakis simplex]|uniref:Pyridine nucleotide-disulfide oxidoreductase domain-containing protein 1 n=1 Tax=Anisakis simplex TaxID=6269 RepID=A0A158PNP7_ANISI|nr:unnamed protein product [Anisakis simplex]
MSTSKKACNSTEYVIVGGGIAAVCCAEEIRSIDSNAPITLITATPLLKVVTNRLLIGQLTESFDVCEKEASSTFTNETNIKIITNKVVQWNAKQKNLKTESGDEISYDKLCIATGGRPKHRWSHPQIISIRDTETLDRLRDKMKNAKRIVVVGNGGIATEVVYELKNVEIIWAIRHESISATFFDEGAAEFFKPMLSEGRRDHKATTVVMQRNKNGEYDNTEPISCDIYKNSANVTTAQQSISSIRNNTSTTATAADISKRRFRIDVDNDKQKVDSETIGCALGPHWAVTSDITGSLKERSVHVIYNVEMESIVNADEAETSEQQGAWFTGDWPLYVRLSDGQILGTDILINATGVEPNSKMWKEQCDELILATDEGIIVNEHMMTSVPDVYACGDVCTAVWKWADHWMQMRLWTQARQMGAYCGRAMVLREIQLDFCFELFTHVTHFFGFKVIFLGRFNGDGVPKPWHALMRITKNEEYIKIIVHNGRVQGKLYSAHFKEKLDILGAVLVGETELEDMVENLILNQIDISDLEDDLLDPAIDIGDYFD